MELMIKLYASLISYFINLKLMESPQNKKPPGGIPQAVTNSYVKA